MAKPQAAAPGSDPAIRSVGGARICWRERGPFGTTRAGVLPAFWLLVPGALGLIGVAEYLGQDPLAGVQDFLGAVGSMVAIGLSVLCGYPLYRSMARTVGWLQELASG
jgi:hypothetical protein